MNGPRTWYDVWQRKGERFVASGRVVPGRVELAALSGYDSRTSALDLGEFDRQRDHIVTSLRIGATDTVYEVGCGAGALLHALEPRCAGVGGSDYAPALVDVARRVLDSGDVEVLEASDVNPRPRYDVVVSNGVFLYFPDAEYARDVVALMAAKARRAVGVFDVNDLARREEHQRARRAAYGVQEAVGGLRQLYLDRAFFTALAADLGLRCVIRDSVMTGSVNGRYRYNVVMSRRGGSSRT
ncbi:class I SAM-dependent methyltransferase [Jiangella alba]|uniref:Methyltransferase domain-containing protein n=1 Tax=Jiangella alba TaxID=561176 RepID=A0A1H5Q0D7_9ACTN|nr:methyltransferase [Jiangella alba]SEF18908.1 Methyltransferase domain-containing protein [Jiangella alba]